MLQNLVSSVQNKNTGGTSAATTAICECLECLQCQVDDISSTVDGMSTQVSTCCVNASCGNISTVNANTGNITNLVSSTANVSGTVTAGCVSSTNASVDCINSTNITATNANVTNLTATNATINGTISPASVSTSCVTATTANVTTGNVTNLTSTCANVCSLSGSTATVDIVNASCGNISNLVSNVVEATTSCVTNANVTTLTATTANANTINANSVTASSIVSCYITADSIKADGTITTSGLSTEESWYTLYIPPYNNFSLQLSGTWNNEEWGINIIGTSETSIVQATHRDLTTIKEVDFVSEGGTYIELRNDSTIKYILHYTDDSYTDSDITVQLNTTPTVDYSYAPTKTKFYIFRGYENNSAEVVIPCLSKIFSIAAEEQSYERTTTDDIYINENIYLSSEWDSGGQPTSCSPGEDNQYISVCNTGCPDMQGCDVCLAVWKTPVDTTTGILSNSTCLITERAVSTYNGTTNAGYPIVHLGDGACGHGLLTADCVCGVCCVETPLLNATNVHSTFANVACDVVIGGDLYVNGTSHIVDEETLEVQGDVLTIRANNSTALSSGQVAGINVNKYDGTNSLSVVTDCSGTLRVGTGAGTDTVYTNIAFNSNDNLWYDYDSSTETYTEMATQPSGTATSWEGKVVDAPYTRYDSITFTVVNVASLEPVLTRAEEADMEDGFVTKWNATDTKAVTTGTICTHNVCTCGNINSTGSVTAAGDVTSATCISAPIVCGTTCVDAPYVKGDCICSTNCVHICNMCTEGNVTVSGDLYVCGDTTIEGIMSSTKLLTAATSCDAKFYPTFVENNNTTAGSEYYFTNGCVSVNPSTGTMYADYYKTNDGCIACTTINNLTAADIGLTAGCCYTLPEVVTAIQNCYGMCASSYSFCYDTSCVPYICDVGYAYNFTFNKLDNNEIGTDCWQVTTWSAVSYSGTYYVKEDTMADTGINYTTTCTITGLSGSTCTSSVPIALTKCSGKFSCICYSACCPLCFTPTTGTLCATRLCGTSCVSTPIVCGTTCVTAPKVCGTCVYATDCVCSAFSCTSCVAYAPIFCGALCGTATKADCVCRTTTTACCPLLLSTGTTAAYSSVAVSGCRPIYFNASSGALTIGSDALVVCGTIACGMRIGLANNVPNACNASVIGICNISCCEYGTAIGFNNTVCGNNGTALGRANMACGEHASAVGSGNASNGCNSNAFGRLNTASGACSSAVGFSNIASTLQSVAVGAYNYACCCSATVAIGRCNAASGAYSAAVGVFNTTSGNDSIAVGGSNTASGCLSSALGRANTACGCQSVAVGYSNIAPSVQSVAIGTNNTASCNSIAFGRGNTASGEGSFAAGHGNTPSGTNSTALGRANTASTDYSVAVGYCNTSSGCDSNAVGSKNTASGCLSSALGRSNAAPGCQSSAIGYYNIAAANSSAVGRLNCACGSYSTAFGNVNIASCTESFAVGRCNTASECSASAVGNRNTASGICSTAVGFCNTASGVCTTAVGYINTASACNASAFGSSNTASGCLSSALGVSNTACGAYSTSIGYNNIAYHDCSTAVGYGNTVRGVGSVIFGRCNSTANVIDSVSIGISNSGCGVSIGRCNITSTYSVTLGSSNNANGTCSIAIGNSSTSNLKSSIAIGNNACVSICGGLAIGAAATSCECCGIVWSTINTSDDTTYGRHGMINLTVPSCAYYCDINIALRHIFTNVINQGRCTCVWGTNTTSNVPVLRAAFYGYYWNDAGSTDGCCRWTPGVSAHCTTAETVYLNNSAAPSSTLTTCQLLYNCGYSIRFNSWDWSSSYTSTSTWGCGLQGVLVY